MYPIPPNEKLIETKTCRHCSASFPITDKDLEFYDKISPVFAGKKHAVPSPTLCPDCRQQRRLSFRNERKLFRRNCDATGKSIVSIYSPDKPFRVYHQDFWWSDAWDSMDYAQDFDFTRPFFSQFAGLLSKVPRPHVVVKMNENSEYASSLGNSKNCYLVSDSDFCEDSMYSAIVKQSKNICDGLNIYMCENIYNSINCTDSSGLTNCFECDGCSFLSGCSRLTGCSYCYESSNLVNQKYMIRNRQVAESEWTEFMKTAPIPLLRDFGIARDTYHIESEDAIGNNIYKSKHITSSYNIGVCENIRYSTLLGWSHDCSDVDGFGMELSRGYESISVGSESDSIRFSDIITSGCSDIFYSHFLVGSTHCFGCVWLRSKSYCILNKQYTKEQYEELVPKIIEHMQKTGEWGEFLPSSISPFGYNETVAQEYFPLDVRDMPRHVSTGVPIFHWSDYESPFPRVAKIIPADKLPDNISQIPDDILTWAIECEVTRKPFRIIQQELEFYRKHNLPIPKRHPDQRHLDRMGLRNPRKLNEWKCDSCSKDILTTYSEEKWPEKVYCKDCYSRKVFG